MKTLRIPSNDLPTRSFKSQDDWKEWLVKNHKRSDGIWLKLAKKGSPAPSLTYAEAVETALCFGWIDGQKKAHDEAWWLQKFTRRGPRSIWSKINRQKVKDLIASGQMQPAGLEAVDSAKRNGRWDSAYNSPGTSNVPSDFHTALKANARAKEFFSTLNSANRYAILWRLQTAKRAETRERRIREFVAMLEKHEKLHP